MTLGLYPTFCFILSVYILWACVCQICCDFHQFTTEVIMQNFLPYRLKENTLYFVCFAVAHWFGLIKVDFFFFFFFLGLYIRGLSFVEFTWIEVSIPLRLCLLSLVVFLFFFLANKLNHWANLVFWEWLIKGEHLYCFIDIFFLT